MRVMGLDIGRKTGYAVYDVPTATLLDSGSHVLGEPSNHMASLLEYPLKLDKFLTFLTIQHHVNVLAFEVVIKHTGTYAAQLWGAQAHTALAFASRNGLKYLPITVQQGKLALTGRENATKDTSVEAARIRFGLNVWSSDQADAIGVALAAAQRLPIAH